MDQTRIWRILDVNSNRVREALRVMEEAARFYLEDTSLTEAVKALRHEASRLIPQAQLDQFAHIARDTAGDVGTAISTAQELSREDVSDVVKAAGKRLTEALRAIEEYGKVIDGALAGQAETLRYQAYDLEAALGAGFAKLKCKSPQWRVCVLITQSLCKLPWQEVIRQITEADVDCIQIREKEMDGGGILAMARAVMGIADEIAEKTGQKRPAIILNDRPDIAMLADCDGVHVGQQDLSVQDVRRLVGKGKYIGISTSQVADAEQAIEDGADYCGVGPMFPTTTKHKPVLAGPDYLKSYLAVAGALPHLAIGGIAEANLPELAEAGCQGIAVSRSVCASDAPGQAVQKMNEMLSSAS